MEMTTREESYDDHDALPARVLDAVTICVSLWMLHDESQADN